MNNVKVVTLDLIELNAKRFLQIVKIMTSTNVNVCCVQMVFIGKVEYVKLTFVLVWIILFLNVRLVNLDFNCQTVNVLCRIVKLYIKMVYVHNVTLNSNFKMVYVGLIIVICIIKTKPYAIFANLIFNQIKVIFVRPKIVQHYLEVFVPNVIKVIYWKTVYVLKKRLWLDVKPKHKRISVNLVQRDIFWKIQNIASLQIVGMLILKILLANIVIRISHLMLKIYVR